MTEWTDWDKFAAQFRISSLGKDLLINEADSPADLAFLPRAELDQLWQRGFMKRASFVRMMASLDSWEVVGALLSLSREDVDALAALVVRPSEFHLELPAKPDHFDKTLWRRVIETVASLAALKTKDAVDEHVWLVEKTPTNFSALGDAFSAISDSNTFAKDNVVVCRGALDESLASVLRPRATSIRSVLDAVPQNRRSHIRALSFGVGYVSDLKPIVDSLDEFDGVCLVDVNINRIDATEVQFGLLKSLVRVMAQRKGACIVAGNPIASFDAAAMFAQFVGENPSDFLHMIWIPESWVEGKAWHGLLGSSEGARQLAPMVALAHKLVYEKWPQDKY
jgi:hypothetical protein